VSEPASHHAHRVSLTVRSTSGSFTEEYSTSDRVERVLKDAEHRFHLATGAGITYLVVRQRGNVTMNPSEKLSAYELVDGDVIVIQTNQPQDG
jgi:hypothetical protein